jgi:outer membrane biosynthesis protein TonB
MRMPARIVAWLLPLLLAGCVHKTDTSQTQPLAPPIEDTPLQKPSKAPANLPPPVITEPQTPQPEATAPPQEAPKPPVKHRKPPKKDAEQAAAENPEVSAIGQLSTGAASDLKRQTMSSIDATEHGLNGINRTLSDPEQKTAALIREDLKQARAALDSGDVDGARTLVAKAKVLLAELSQ